MQLDVLVFGGGAAGLWCLHQLRRGGYHAILLESTALGSGQTIRAQGIIHGGGKYALRGVRDFMDAMEHGRDREGVIGTLAQLSGFDPAVLAKAGYFPIRRDGHVNVEALQAMLDWLVERGYVSQKPDLAPLLDAQFADYAQHTLDAAR